MPKIPQAGRKAPPFSASTQDGDVITLASLKDQWVLLYFYPRDDTPGCTTQACGLRDAWKDFRKTGAVVLGVSPDPVKSHAKFAKKFKLPFPLLADEDKAIVRAYGVWGEKKFMGRAYMGVHRTTFLIAPGGKIHKVWEKVKPDTHAAEVMEELQLRVER